MGAVDELCLNALNVEDDEICIVIRKDPLGYLQLIMPQDYARDVLQWAIGIARRMLDSILMPKAV